MCRLAHSQILLRHTPHIQTCIHQSGSHPWEKKEACWHATNVKKLCRPISSTTWKSSLKRQRETWRESLTEKKMGGRWWEGLKGCNFVLINFSAQTFWEINRAWWVCGAWGVVGRRDYWYVCVHYIHLWLCLPTVFTAVFSWWLRGPSLVEANEGPSCQ